MKNLLCQETVSGIIYILIKLLTADDSGSLELDSVFASAINKGRKLKKHTVPRIQLKYCQRLLRDNHSEDDKFDFGLWLKAINSGTKYKVETINTTI